MIMMPENTLKASELAIPLLMFVSFCSCRDSAPVLLDRMVGVTKDRFTRGRLTAPVAEVCNSARRDIIFFYRVAWISLSISSCWFLVLDLMLECSMKPS